MHIETSVCVLFTAKQLGRISPSTIRLENPNNLFLMKHTPLSVSSFGVMNSFLCKHFDKYHCAKKSLSTMLSTALFPSYNHHGNHQY